MGSKSGGNQTTRTEPPKYQLPYLERGLGYAQDQYSRTGSIPNVAPLSSESTQALDHITQRANYNPITGAQQDLATKTMQGGFLGSNPYLDATFNKAALATQNQLASQFAGSGRNVEASEGLRSQQLNDLATQVYGGAYENERNRQNQVLGMSPQLQQGAYADYDRLAGVGASREGYQQELLDAPGQALDQYLNRVSGNMGQTLINSGSRNRGAGVLGGGMMGAQMGGQFGPWGSLIGGIGGGLLGGFG
jgi:hypothetical protein